MYKKIFSASLAFGVGSGLFALVTIAFPPSPAIYAATEEKTTTSISDTTKLDTTTQLSEEPTLLKLDSEKNTSTLEVETASTDDEKHRLVPFFSQFSDISQPSWRKVSCGVASLAMIINHYKKDTTSADTLLTRGIAANAYTDAGWSHAGLISLAKAYDITGESRSLAHLTKDDAFAELKEVVSKDPVMVSVHYTFEPTNPIPHLVVVTDIDGDTVFYNDPAEPQGDGSISREKFSRAWKQRYIAFWTIN